MPATLKAADLNRWRTPMINAASDILLNRQLFDEPATYSAEGVEMRSVLDWAWVLRARYYLGIGDMPAAEAAPEELQHAQALDPEGTAHPALVPSLVNDIALAKPQG